MENMAKHRLRFWTGPVNVEAIGAKAREAGLSVAVVGTEHLLIDSYGRDHIDAVLKVSEAMKRTHGTNFGMVRA